MAMFFANFLAPDVFKCSPSYKSSVPMFALSMKVMLLVLHCSFTNSLVCLIFSLAAVVSFLSSTRSLLLTIDDMYILAVVAFDCRSIAFFTISSAMPVGDSNVVLLLTQFVPTCRTISCTSLMSVGWAAVAGTAPLVLLIVTLLPHSLPRPCLLRANVIESPMTNASLQASAVAGCSVGVSYSSLCLSSHRTICRSIRSVWLNQVNQHDRTYMCQCYR